jgi:hypothetical protein
MRYFPQRGPRTLDVSLLLKVCPDCLGDLVFCSETTGDYYRCIQCDHRTERRDGIGQLVDLPTRLTVPADDFFPSEATKPKAIAS